jgi:anti-sigma factor RsiW
MNCADFHAHLHAYYVGTLTAVQRRGIEQHATACADCGRLYALAQELSCREFVEFLDDYVQGRLAPERRAVFERHIAICGDCTKYLDGYRKTLRATRAAAEQDAQEPPPSLPEDLIRAILEARGS